AANENEYRRLLYVAMTRAADRLIVCGAVGEKEMPAGCWYELVRQGLEGAGLLIEADADFGDGKVKRHHKSAAENGAGKATAVAADAAGTRLPDWLAKPAQAEPAQVKPIAPSSALGVSPMQSGNNTAARTLALARGRLVHRLMQSLPDVARERRAEAAKRYLQRNAKNFTAQECEAIAAQVLAVLDDPRFSKLFSPGSRAEVPIVGRIGDPPRPVSGQVDRLAVTPDAVLIADYKTNFPVPAAPPEAYVTQLALYRAVLVRLYPGRAVRAALIWTEAPDIIEISSSALDAALAAVAARGAP
ncbi:MAG: PD-(D/E)XK nuclease family protein, partial [Xanthobacteraceae bacterium]